MKFAFGACLALVAVSADAAKSRRSLQTSTAMSISNAEPFQTFYVPLPEEDVFHDMFRKINNRQSNGQYWVRGDMISLVSVAVSTDNTVMWVDHQEDGYDVAGEAPSATSEVWGDGDCSNGFRPDLDSCVNGADDNLMAGDSFVIESQIALPRNPNNYFIDGGDKIQASYPVAITRGEYAEYPGSLLAGAVEVHDTANWGVAFETPVGNDSMTETYAFQYSRLFIMSGTNGNIVTMPNGNQVTLNEGESTSVDVKEGNKITSTHPVQVDLCTGDVGSNYELRWFSIVPTEDWTDKYMSPVGDDFGRTKMILYNPNPSQIVIDFTYIDAGVTKTEKYTLQSKERIFSRVVPTGSGGLAESPGNKFIALSMTDTEVRAGTSEVESENEWLNGQAFDWGFPVVPVNKLTPQILIGWGYGCTANDCHGKTERSAVWVSPTQDADVYVDYQNTGADYELMPMKKLESKMVRDTIDHDMSGAVIFATVQGSGPHGEPVDIAAAWGQDPAVSRQTQSISLDLGTVVLPFTTIRSHKSVDKATAAPGEKLVYTITVQNVGQNVVKANSYTINDSLPAQVVYTAGSATCSTDGGDTFVAVPDDAGPSTPFPFDEAGFQLNEDLERRGGTHQVRFEVTIDPSKVAADDDKVVNTGFVTPPLGPNDPFEAVTTLVPPTDTKTGTKDPVPLPTSTPPICMQEVYDSSPEEPGSLVCRQDDIFFEQIKATGRDSCKAGSYITVSLEGIIRVKEGTSDPGWYIATDGGDAKTGTCSSGALYKGGAYPITSGATTKDIAGKVTFNDGDDCGDLEISNNAGAVVHISSLMTDQDIKCVDSNKDGSLDISVCFTWRGSADNNVCNLSTGLYPANTAACYCRKYQIPEITVMEPNDPLTKTC